MDDDLGAVFDAVGCVGHVCVQVEGVEREVTLDAERPVVAASVIKVLVAVAAENAFADGSLDPRARVLLPSSGRTPGPTGFSLFADDVEVSARDLVPAMLTISDNVAADALLGLVGVDACHALAAGLGLGDTVVVGDLATMIGSIASAAGFADWDAMIRWAGGVHPPEEDAEVDRRVRASAALDPGRATRTTARDLCVLVRAVWEDRAGPPEACARVRASMARQLTRNRVAAAFPPPAQVAAKSGSLMGVVRHEVAAVRLPDGRRAYAAVLTEAPGPVDGAAVDAAIGTAVAAAVGDLTTG